MFRTLLILGRVSNLPTVWTNTLVGWFLVGGNWSWQLLWLVVGISLIYIAGMTLNDAFDADWDREHAPDRPIPSGKISHAAVWQIGWAQMIVGTVISIGLGGASMIWIAALVGAVLLYDWLHKHWTGSVLIMGLCRGLVYLSAGSAVAGVLVPEAAVFWIAGAMVLYIAGITLTARGERTDGYVSKVVASLLLFLFPIMGVLRIGFHQEPEFNTSWLFIGGLTLFLGWTTIGRKRINRGQIGPAVAWFLAGIIVLDAIAMAYADWRIALGFLLLALPLTLAAQRRIPAT